MSDQHRFPTLEAQSQAALDVLAERRRQIEALGWTVNHDDQHADGELAKAAATYAWASSVHPAIRELGEWGGTANYRRLWPWHDKWWKPKDRRSDLVKAGALILAEIERLDRALKDSQP